MGQRDRKMRLTEAHVALLPTRIDDPGPRWLNGAVDPPDHYYAATTAALIDAVPADVVDRAVEPPQPWRDVIRQRRPPSTAPPHVDIGHEEVGPGFDVALIPHTVAHTRFAHTNVGDAVNLEIDLVARYVERLLAGRAE